MNKPAKTLARESRLIPRASKRRHQVDGFSIEILFPGFAPGATDSGIGSIGRIDDANISPGTLVGMHPHQDDEILTYLRTGGVVHKDTVGDTERISPRRLMLMNAGARYQHEELVDPEGGPLRALQIFLRPSKAALPPQVQFHDFASATSEAAWRRIAGPTPEDPLVVRSATWVDDGVFPAGSLVDLPSPPPGTVERLLYVFSGVIEVSGLTATAGDAVLLTGTTQSFTPHARSELVLLTTDISAPVFKGGMFSGNAMTR